MKDTVHPIRPGIEPEMDVKRELAVFASQAVAEHTGDPFAVVVVVLARCGSTISCWEPDGVTPNSMIKSFAAALLLHDAAS